MRGRKPAVVAIGVVLSGVCALAGCGSPAPAAPAVSTAVPAPPAAAPPGTPPSAAADAPPTENPQDAGRNPAEAFNITDVTFLQLMLAHHQQALEMANLAGTRAENPAVQAVAKSALDANPAEIQQMGNWLLSLGIDPSQISSAGAHAHSGTMTEQDVANLAALRGAAFDDSFLDLMIQHSLGATGMAQEEGQTGQNAGVLRLAGQIGKRESDQVLVMQRLL